MEWYPIQFCDNLKILCIHRYYALEDSVPVKIVEIRYVEFLLIIIFRMENVILWKKKFFTQIKTFTECQC